MTLAARRSQATSLVGDGLQAVPRAGLKTRPYRSLHRLFRETSRPQAAVIVGIVVLTTPAIVFAQRGRGAQASVATAKAAAPVDLTGYWVSVVTEDWRYRMMTPKKGDHPSIPLNTEGVRVASTWDPAKDEAAGDQCKSYGAIGVMRAPGRIRISWRDENTLQIDTEAGTQTRLLHFGAAQPGETAASWQGLSAAQWEFAGGGRRGGQARGPLGGNLKVVTTQMRPGYLQKNGVPYSATASLTEYLNRTIEPNGDSWLILTAVVEDRQYLTGRFVRSTHFKKLPDNDAGWSPEPCSSR